MRLWKGWERAMYCSVTDQIFAIIRLLEEEQKQPRDYGGVLLSHTEVQFLETVARYPGENASALSGRLGITKGAVTQMVAKLGQKALLEGVRREDNKKEKFLRLTQRGAMALEGHQRYHQQANQRLCRFIAELDGRETEAIFRFLEHLKACVPFCEFPCVCGAENRKDKEETQHEAISAVCTRSARRA